MQRRQFLAGAAGLIAGALAPRLALANVPTPFTFDMTPPMDNREKFIAWGVAQRGEDPKFLGERFDRFGAMVRNEDLAQRPPQARLPADAAREIRAAAESRPRLRARLPRHRLRRDDLRPAHRRPHDLEHRSQAGREGARDRHRLGLPVGLSLAPDRQGLHDRDHQAAGRAHARHLRPADQGRLQRVQGDHVARPPTAITAGRRRRRSTRSSSPAASTTFRRRCCSS